MINLKAIQDFKEQQKFEQDCTFKPQINQKSVELVIKRMQDKLEEEYYPKHRLEDYDSNNTYRPKVNEIVDVSEGL